MRFVCRSHLTNTKISIDKRRLSHIFVFVAHSPHRNKNVMFEPKKSSTRDTIFFFSSQMQKIQVTSNSTTVQPLHSLYNNWILSDILLLIFWIPAKQKKLFVTRGFWVRRYVLQEVQWTSVLQRPKRSVDHWCFQCPYRYVLNERKRPQDQRYSAKLRKLIKYPRTSIPNTHLKLFWHNYFLH